MADSTPQDDYTDPEFRQVRGTPFPTLVSREGMYYSYEVGFVIRGRHPFLSGAAGADSVAGGRPVDAAPHTRLTLLWLINELLLDGFCLEILVQRLALVVLAIRFALLVCVFFVVFVVLIVVTVATSFHLILLRVGGC